MIKRGFLTALLAELYIINIALLIQNIFSVLPNEDSILIPVVMLSLIVLSVSVMGCLFVFQPLELFVNDGLKSATRLLLYTIGFFAVFTGVAIALLLAGIFA